MIYLKRFVLMIQFLTTIPLGIQLKVTNEDFGRGLVFAPLVGLILGGILTGAHYILGLLFPTLVTSVLVMIIYILLTGGLHLDGLGDTFDGLFSNRSRERMLEIMRDSRVGTNAVLAIVSVLFLNVSLLSGLKPSFAGSAVLLMPVAGRIGSLVGAGCSTYARSGEGLGKSFIDICGFREVLAGLVPYLAVFYIFTGWKGVLTAWIPVLGALVTVRLFSRKIGGATGDVLGAVCELNQTIFLAAIFVVQALGIAL